MTRCLSIAISLVFDSLLIFLRVQSKLLPVKAVKAWADIQELLDEEVLTETELNGLIAEVQGKKKGDLDFPSFKALLDRIDEVTESKEDDDNDDDDATEVDGNEEFSKEEVEALTQRAMQIYNELRGKVGNVCVFSLKLSMEARFTFC